MITDKIQGENVIKLSMDCSFMPVLPQRVFAHELIADDPLAVHHVINKTDAFSIV